MEEFEIALRILKRSWWIILSTIVLAVLVTGWINTLSISIYQTNLRLFVTADLERLEGRDLIYGYSSLDGASIVTTFVELTNSRRIREIAAGKFNQPVEFFDPYTTSAVDLPNSSVLELVVTGPDPQIVQSFANLVAQSAVEFVSSNYSAYKLEILDSAYLPTVPVKPDRLQNLVVALILGAVLGTIIAVSADLLPNPMQKVQEWVSIDRPTLTLKRGYFELHLDDWLFLDSGNVNLALIHLDSLSQLKQSISRNRFKELLKEITRIIWEEVRGKDIIIRWNDESFAVLMPGVCSDQVPVMLEQISRRLSNLTVKTGHLESEQLRPVIGAVMVTERLSYPTIIERAELALAEAGKNGSKPILYSPALSIQREFSDFTNK